jgi:hypothetical protein
MVVQISCKNNKLEIAFYDMGTPVKHNDNTTAVKDRDAKVKTNKTKEA